MCTAISYHGNGVYFGRTLDLKCSLGERVTVMPRKYRLKLSNRQNNDAHYAIIGMAFVKDGYPLYYDAVNECGLGMAGLNFPANAFYAPPSGAGGEVAPYEFIPYVLSVCKNVSEARALIEKSKLCNIAFSPDLPAAPLHWMLADDRQSIVVEPMRDGIKIYDNPLGIMTNNPPFPEMMSHVALYRALSPGRCENTFTRDARLSAYCEGMGAFGLPGDFSSPSRFVRGAFVKSASPIGESEEECVNQFFHILDCVSMPLGAVRLAEDEYDYTVYSSCCSIERGVYYYTTYNNRRIFAVDMHAANLEGCEIIQYSPDMAENISYVNR